MRKDANLGPSSWTIRATNVVILSHDNVDQANPKYQKSYHLKVKKINFGHKIPLKMIFFGLYWDPYTL